MLCGQLFGRLYDLAPDLLQFLLRGVNGDGSSPQHQGLILMQRLRYVYQMQFAVELGSQLASEFKRFFGVLLAVDGYQNILVHHLSP